MSASATTPLPAASVDADESRHGRADRRDSLLDVAADMVANDVEAVSMDAVARAAGVSRALVYKHFANRHDLLSSLYERESARVHAQLSADVRAASDLAGMLRALVRGALAAQASRGATFAALSAGGGRSPAQRDVRRRRDGQTLRYFTNQAVREFGVTDLDARSGLAIALGAIPTVLSRWRLRPTSETALLLEGTFVAMVIGGMKELVQRRGRPGHAEPDAGASHGPSVRTSQQG
jgi:AcrR family transcriptional regulator